MWLDWLIDWLIENFLLPLTLGDERCICRGLLLFQLSFYVFIYRAASNKGVPDLYAKILIVISG